MIGSALVLSHANEPPGDGSGGGNSGRSVIGEEQKRLEEKIREERMEGKEEREKRVGKVCLRHPTANQAEEIEALLTEGRLRRENFPTSEHLR